MSINAISFARNVRHEASPSSRQGESNVDMEDILGCIEDHDTCEIIGKAQDGMQKTADTLESSSKIKSIIGVPVKIATVAGLGALGFFTGKLFFANPITKKVIGFVAKVPQKLGFDASGLVNKGFDKVYDFGVGMKKSILATPVKRTRKFISDYFPVIKRKIAEFTEKWFKDGVNVDKIKEAARLNKVIGRAPITSAIRRAFIQNGLLKTIGAIIGVYKGVDAARDAFNTPVDGIPGLLRKYANPAAATLIGQDSAA